MACLDVHHKESPQLDLSQHQEAAIGDVSDWGTPTRYARVKAAGTAGVHSICFQDCDRYGYGWAVDGQSHFEEFHQLLGQMMASSLGARIWDVRKTGSANVVALEQNLALMQ